MKKYLIAVFCICLLLSSCGKNMVIETQKAIDSIGKVTLGSEQAIERAEEMFSSLTEQQKELVNPKILERSRLMFDNLYKEKLEVEEAINLITDVTLENADIIDKAYDAYDSLSTENKKYVSNSDVLLDAKDKLNELRVTQLINIINQLENVTLLSEEQINNAFDIYSRLDDKYKEKVTNYNALKNAQNRLFSMQIAEEEKIKEQTKQDILSQFNSNYDKVNDVMFYFPSVYPEYINTRSYILPYLSVNQYSASVRLQINYTGDNWIFFDNITIWIDGENYYKSFDYSDIVRDNEHGDVWEYVDFSTTGENTDYIGILRKIANSNETIVRFQGRERSYDLTVSTSDKNAINEILTAYDTIKSL